MVSVNDMEMHLTVAYETEFLDDAKIDVISNKIIDDNTEAYTILGE